MQSQYRNVSGSAGGHRPHSPHGVSSHSLRVRLTAAELAKALGGQRSGRGWIARCPAHDDRNPSFSIDEGKDGTVLVHCHSKCTQEQVISALRRRGLWPDTESTFTRRVPHRPPPPRASVRDATKIGPALQIWDAASPAHGTIVEEYLTNERGVFLPPVADIRFHPALRHKCGSTFGGMVALVTDCLTREPIGIHRTFLTDDGKKADVDPARMMLGHCVGGVVRLGPNGPAIVVGEGIETTLSGMVGSTFSGWAALSTVGLQRILAPPDVSEVCILADGDEAGRHAADVASRNLARAGKLCRVASAPEGFDFNDMLLGRATPPSLMN